MPSTLLQKKDLQDVFFEIGVPHMAIETENATKTGDILISPKDYSNILRTLYYSSYLKRYSSNLLLSYLTQTRFEKSLPAGVPPDVKVAHKVGYYLAKEGEEHHDCGIFYYDHSPYILCIMTQGLTQEEADAFAAQISRITYDFMEEQIGTDGDVDE